MLWQWLLLVGMALIGVLYWRHQKGPTSPSKAPAEVLVVPPGTSCLTFDAATMVANIQKLEAIPFESESAQVLAYARLSSLNAARKGSEIEAEVILRAIREPDGTHARADQRGEGRHIEFRRVEGEHLLVVSAFVPYAGESSNQCVLSGVEVSENAGAPDAV